MPVTIRQVGPCFAGETETARREREIAGRTDHSAGSEGNGLPGWIGAVKQTVGQAGRAPDRALGGWI